MTAHAKYSGCVKNIPNTTAPIKNMKFITGLYVENVSDFDINYPFILCVQVIAALRQRPDLRPALYMYSTRLWNLRLRLYMPSIRN